MEHVNWEVTVAGLKFLATAATGIFAGTNVYITLVDEPARRSLSPPMAITAFKEFFPRAGNLQFSLLFLAGSSAVLAGSCSYKAGRLDKSWLAAGSAILLLFPYTMSCLMPLNMELLKTEKNIKERGNVWITENLTRWGRLHSLRTVIAVGSFAYMTYRLAKS